VFVKCRVLCTVSCYTADRHRYAGCHANSSPEVTSAVTGEMNGTVNSRHQCACHSLAPSAAVVSVTLADVAKSIENSPHPGNKRPPSESVYDDIGDVIEDEDEDTAAESQDNCYDGLQLSTRDIISQAPSVYEQIRSETAASVANSDAIAHQDKYPLYLQIIADDETLPEEEEFTKTFRNKCQKHSAASADTAAKASTL